MFTLKIENARGEIFEISHNTQNYAVTGVRGLTPPPTSVNTATGGNIDGTFFNSAHVNQRNIVITLVLNGDIERNRQRLYKIFNIKSPCTIYFKNERRDVKIVGYVETLDGNLFSMREQIQISIICPRPYFEDLETIYTELSQVVRMFEFPFSIEVDDPVPFSEIVDIPLCTVFNGGDVSCGCKMQITTSATVEMLKIYHTTAQTFFGLDYRLIDGDTVDIDTTSGNMGVTLTRSGVKSNLLNYVSQGSTWFSLLPGDNDFAYTANTNPDAVRIMFAIANLYGGV